MKLSTLLTSQSSIGPNSEVPIVIHSAMAASRSALSFIVAVGLCEREGISDGTELALGAPLGTIEGIDEVLGARLGIWEGTELALGAPLGTIEGIAEVLGAMLGIWEGT